MALTNGMSPLREILGALSMPEARGLLTICTRAGKDTAVGLCESSLCHPHA